MDNFYEKMAELLEVDKVEDSEVLKDFEAWDSLTSLSIIAMADSDYNIKIYTEDLLKLETIGELKSLIDSKAKK